MSHKGLWESSAAAADDDDDDDDGDDDDHDGDDIQRKIKERKKDKDTSVTPKKTQQKHSLAIVSPRMCWSRNVSFRGKWAKGFIQCLCCRPRKRERKFLLSCFDAVF